MKSIYTTLLLLLIKTAAFSQSTYYVNDGSNAGDVFTSATGSNSNAGTAALPFATLSYAISQAAASDIIYVDAGTYAEQVIINKGITIIGAGQNLTSFIPPATPLVPAPGPFTEIGLFATTQGIGDVHIRNLYINSINGSQNIIIQSGGSVKNCTLLNGGQAIFFRVESAIKTVLIENNYIQPQGIGINCQGSGLTATITNNTITNPAGFYAGIFGGLDFGPLPQLTIQNNLLTNTGFSGIGMEVNSYNGNYNLNSIVGFSFAISTYNTGNTPNATCNWYGTTTAGTIAGMISGSINYIPYITNSTDNSSNNGFQPVNAACSGRNVYYVNDNSLAGDVFTSAIGSNSNNGSASAPFASISYALTQAAADDYIYVDAGTYTEQVTTDKGITIIGAGQNLTSILKPAITIAPPGAFTEQGVIQTAQSITGDVHISNLSVTGGLNPGVTPIIIQSGGSVRNCRIQNGNQGIFVRIDPSINLNAKTFVVDRNSIDAEYIAVNFAGGIRLTAILTNNNITAFNPGSSGTWAGTDFGTLSGLTITGNSYSSYGSDGLFINSNNCTISQNSFIGVGQKAINKFGGSTINANCNWYGSADVNVVALKITPGVNFAPWLVNGTDNSGAVGFQPVANACTGKQTRFYVNNNTSATRIFTTAAGSDANPGIPSLPFATISAAYQKAQTGDSLFLDAGTYSPGDGTIGKSISIIGTNYLLSPNDAANPLLINSTRNAETIIDNLTWTIGANDINLEGLTFNSVTKQIIAQNNTSFSNIKLARNRVTINSNLTLFNFTGSGTTTMAPSAIVNSGLTITDSRFEKYDAGGGLTLTISRFRNIAVTNNSFVVAGTTVRTQTASFFGGSGVVDGVYFANNTIDKASNAFFGSRMNAVFIFGNKINNTNNAFFATNAMPESSYIIFNNNILDGSGGIVPFIQYTRTGGNAVGATSSFTAEENIITGTAVASTTTLLGSMNLIFFNAVLNPSLTVRNNKITYVGDLSTVPAHLIRPLMLRGNLANAIVEKNEINLTGINQQPKSIGVDFPVSPAITLYTENGTTSFLQPGSVINILNNKINGFKNSFAAYDATAGKDTYIGYGNIPAGVTVNINNNSFTGDSMSINNGTQSQSIYANCNWYGSVAAQNFINKLSLATVDIAPWLTNGTDNDVATGFQPVPNTCDGYPTLITLNSSTNVTCNGAANGTISITTTYGKAPFTYTWTKDEDAGFLSNDEDPTGLAPGTYRLAITDGNGSNIYIIDENADGPGTIVVSITEPSVLTASADGTNNACYGQLNGTATVTPGGGTTPYTYLWSNGATASSLSNLAAGIYNVTVTDANGCTASSSYEVTQPSIVTASANGTNVSCFNGTNGSASVTPGGGTAPYTYLWSNGATSSSISSLVAGVYNVTVTDANGCAALSSYEVTQPTLLTASANGTNVSCFGGNNGTASVSVSGGTSAYSYLWSNSATTSSISNLIAGIYSVTVTDANGCTANSSYEVKEPALLTASANGTNVSCFGGNNGTASVNVNGGTAAYSYLWNNGATTSSISNLIAGIYSVTITDANGCTASSSYEVTQPLSAVTASVAVVNNICYNGTAGSITVSASGGTGSYTYSLNGTTYQAGNVFNNLAAGSYTAYVQDGNGCINTKDTTITQPTAISITIGTITSACAGTSNGAIASNAVGGTGILLYSWTGPNGFTKASKNISNLAAGVYNLTVTDANGCTATRQVTVPGLPAITASAIITSVSCFGTSTGAINLTPGGGSGAFSFNWTGPNGYKAFTEDISNVKAGTYAVTITDAAGCSLSASYTVTQPSAALTAAAVKTDITICGGTGSITVNATGGTTAYQYKLNSGTPQPGNVFSGLATGTYTITVTDAKGCIVTLSVTIIDAGYDLFDTNAGNNDKQSSSGTIALGQPVFSRIAPTNADIDWYKFTSSTAGAYTISFTHPSVTYLFALYDNKGKVINPASSTATTKTYNLLAANTVYYIKISGTVASFVCYNLMVNTGTAPLQINKNLITGDVPVNTVDNLKASVFPNPHQGHFTLQVASPEDGMAVIELYAADGKLIKKQQAILLKGTSNTVFFTNIREAILFYRVRLGKHAANGKIIGSQ